ncbi:hypothetical protein GU3_06075 [Oceanimonas sp. GK1]|uniref:DUF1439 domain-containing protein n=1 Tax=Oceanimonas sp. (strain GK1 / IBRC-M 10197) TaxID=511062 RepID=UPI00024952BB|nr:DUF1439 domain-containing protein [Oceanimonas sp. GK1]AEY00971.1 hypothetical protein GU3_06075 [Oceanimonas sp. GK1]
MFRTLTLALSALLLSACASFSQYSVSESELEKALYTQLEEQAPRFTQGLVETRIDNLDLTIGPDSREVVRLDIRGETAINALIARFPAALDLQLEGRPVYDRQKNAIFIRDLALLKSQVNAFGYQGDVAAASAGMMQLVRAVLENQPVYRLDDSRYRWVKNVPVALDIVPGRLVLSPRFGD